MPYSTSQFYWIIPVHITSAIDMVFSSICSSTTWQLFSSHNYKHFCCRRVVFKLSLKNQIKVYFSYKWPLVHRKNGCSYNNIILSRSNTSNFDESLLSVAWKDWPSFFVGLRHIQQNERVIQGLDGNLYFSHVTVEDNREDYTCNTQFPSARIIMLKDPIKLTVVACKQRDG